MQSNKRNKSGFTLVELIVVLVILAVLAAMLVPALTGYIDKAQHSTVIAETRSLVQATQTEMSTLYASDEYAEQLRNRESYFTVASKDGTPFNADRQTITGLKDRYDSIVNLAEVPSVTNGTGEFLAITGTDGKIYVLMYSDGKGHIGLYFANSAEYVVLDTKDGYSFASYSMYAGKVVGLPLDKASDKTPEASMWSKDNVIAILGWH